VIKLVFCLTRRENLSHEEFIAYWRDVHAPLVAKHAEALGIKRYVQSYANALGDAVASVRAAPDAYDGIAELWFESVEAFTTSTPSQREIGKLLLDDERTFIDLSRSPLFLTEELTIV
jgi:uncharacterized protein (TIGR02118 family)